ncbi:MAG: homoserine dehydrogenase [Lysobacteraceae bacterium]|nr:MAG: homoserine dehydrogenase [Xanthomonadaceae bacterium]
MRGRRVNAARRLDRCHDTAIALLGTGGVGAALLRRLATPEAVGLRLVALADSRRQWSDAAGIDPRSACRDLDARGAPREARDIASALARSGARRCVVVDATANEAVAACHAGWLAAGYHVVSANKAALAGSHAAWSALQCARASGARYGDAATVGAGLPVLSTLRRLRACGDRVLAIEGVFSGSLSWLFNGFDGSRPFSERVREAQARGYTEPDPRLDLAGIDVARKLLILARSAGQLLEPVDVECDGLVPDALRDVDRERVLSRMHELDGPLEQRRRDAARRGRVLRFGARWSEGEARVGLVEVASDDPLARLQGTDNLFALTTRSYRERPLLIQGPGAGVEVTAQALLGDLLAVRGGEARAAA